MKYKKGVEGLQNYFTLVGLIVGIAAYLIVSLDYTFQGFVGEQNFYIRDLRDKSFDTLNYIDASATYATAHSIIETGRYGGTFGEKCGYHHGYAIWKSASGEDCAPTQEDLSSTFGYFFNERMSEFAYAHNLISLYPIPLNNYDSLELKKLDPSGNNQPTLELSAKPTSSIEVTQSTSSGGLLPYENLATKVNGPEFVPKLREMSNRLGIQPECLMKAIYFESGSTFNPQAVNKQTRPPVPAGYDENGKLIKPKGVPDDDDPYTRSAYRATGLIQFMPGTAKGLGTTNQQLFKMNGVQQLKYVEDYFLQNLKGKKINSCVDIYFVIFYPFAIGKDDSFVLGSQISNANAAEVARQNPSFDKYPQDGFITAGEVRQFKKAQGWA